MRNVTKYFSDSSLKELADDFAVKGKKEEKQDSGKAEEGGGKEVEAFKKLNPSLSAVQHPSHYQSGKIEAIDVIEDFNLGFCLGNVIKYVLRAGKKKEPGKSVTESEVQDLEKAEWYLSREIKTLRTAFSMDSSSEKPAEKEILYGP